MKTPAVAIGAAYRFDYPSAFVTLPEYSAHRGQIVTVTRALTEAEADGDEVGPMFEIVAADGWVGHAFNDELVE